MEEATDADVIDGYAKGLLAIAEVEGEKESVPNELFAIGRAVEGSDELRTTMTDLRIPIERKQALLADVLAGRVTRMSIAIVSMLVGAGKSRDVTAVGRRMIELAAAAQELTIAEVRSVIALDQLTVERLEQKLSAATGKRIKANVYLDTSVVGGLVAQVGDTVFDGSVRSRIQELREAWT